LETKQLQNGTRANTYEISYLKLLDHLKLSNKFAPFLRFEAGKDGSKTRTTTGSKSLAKVEPFYMGTKDNAKGSVFIQYPRSKSAHKAVPIVAISEKEENMTTKEVKLKPNRQFKS